MLRAALTGGIATGKSYVLTRFAALGLPTIDSDVLARDVVEPGTAGLVNIVERFGPAVLDKDGRLNRACLAERVFADPRARSDLEAIIHPRVYAAIDSWFESLTAVSSAGLAAIPLLFETGHAGAFDVVVVTTCRPDAQLERIQRRDRLSESAARLRIAAQWPIEEKERLGDYVIRTDGTFEQTDASVEAVFAALNDRAMRTVRP